MKPYITIRNLWLILAALMLSIVACEKEPEPDPDPIIVISEDTLMINRWIHEGLEVFYLWESLMPAVNITKEPDPRVLFQKLLYDGDKDSWITDDYEELLASFDGVELATGMSAYPALVTDDQVIWGVVFVTPDSPAADSGIVRGDVVITVDGTLLNTENYYDLFFQTTATLGFGEWDGVRMQPNGKSVTLTAIELNQNPIIHSEVIDYQGYKIGYLSYAQFIEGESGEWLVELNKVFDTFKSEGVTDVIMDLRYNPGGYLYISAYMASTLVTASAMQNREIYVQQEWNYEYTEFWKNQDENNDGRADGEESPRLVQRFSQSDYNMDLSRIYFLTTDRSASASESLMVGLYPYMEVVQIGTITYGKCYGSITVDDWEEPKRHNWAMQPIVLKYANADGYSDFVNGIPPDIFVNESLIDLKPFGSFEDPMLAKALEEISGVAPEVKKSAVRDVKVTPLPMPRKKVVEQRIQLPDKPVELEIF